jgi:hypothetical protein
VNPYYVSAIVAGTVGALVVATYDEGRSRTPPANAINQLLAVTTASSTATIVVVNTVTGALYTRGQAAPHGRRKIAAIP